MPPERPYDATLEPPPPDPPPPAPDPGLCPRCSAPRDVYQEYCLECGIRLPPPGGARRREVWSRESPVWLWGAILALLLVAGLAAAIVALAAVGDDGEAGGKDSVPVVATRPGTTDTVGVITDAGTVTIAPPTTTILPPTTTIPTTTTFPTTTTTGTGAGAGTTTWPAGRDGFTVVLKSVPTSQGRAQADAAAQQALSQGLTQVGVLNSSDYTSLRPGYYVTFSGIYTSQRQAEGALPNARSRGFPLAYVREVRD